MNPLLDRPPIGRRVLVVVGTLALLVGLIVGGRQAGQHHRTAELQARLDTAYRTARPGMDERRRAGNDALSALAGPARLRLDVLSCQLDADYAGFNVSSRHVDCVVRTVDAYRTSRSYREIARALDRAAAGRTGLWLGDPVPGGPPPRDCGLLRSAWVESADGAAAQVAVTRLSAGGFDPEESIDMAGHGCAAPARYYPSSAERIESSFDPAELDPRFTWVVVERTTWLPRQELECTGWTCDPRVSWPVLPRP